MSQDSKVEGDAAAGLARGGPPPVAAVAPQLMDQVAITEAARRLGIRLVITTPRELAETCRRESPGRIVLDLTDSGALDGLGDPACRGIPTIGFYPHVQQELRERAMRAGLDRAVPRSAFFGRLAEWLAPGADRERLPDLGGGC